MRLIIMLLCILFATDAYSIYITDHRTPDPSSAALAGISFKSGHHDSPSAMCSTDTTSAYASYRNDYFLAELSLWHVSLSIPTSFAIISGGIIRFGYEDYNETGFLLNVSKKLSSKLHIAFNIRTLVIYYDECDTKPIKLTADIGAKYSFNPKLSLYFSTKNIAQSLISDPSERMYQPTETMLGTALSISDNIEWDTEVACSNMEKHMLKTALSYSFDMFTFRCGIHSSPLIPTLGIGFSPEWITIDVGTQYHNALGYSLSLGIGKKF